MLAFLLTLMIILLVLEDFIMQQRVCKICFYNQRRTNKQLCSCCGWYALLMVTPPTWKVTCLGDKMNHRHSHVIQYWFKMAMAAVYDRRCKVLLFITVSILYISICSAKPPNIVFVLTDDQDTEVGGQVGSLCDFLFAPTAARRRVALAVSWAGKEGPFF